MDWMTSECKKRLWGMTTAPRMLVTTGTAPAGTLGTTQFVAAWGQSTSTIASSARNDSPTTLTNAMIQRSAFLYELVSSIAIEAAATMRQPARSGRPKSICSAIAPPRTSAIAVATHAR